MIAKRYAAASAAGLLPAIGIALLVAVLLSAGLSGFVTYRWNKGTEAIAQVQRQAKDIKELTAAARALQQHGVDRAAAYDAATKRMDAIASTLEKNLEQDRLFAAEQRTALDALAAARPDLRSIRLGDDVLRHWNRSNQGAAGGTVPAAKPAGKPAPALPGAAAGKRQRRAGTSGQPRRGGTAIPPVQRARGLAGSGGGRVGDHGLDLVLRLGRGNGFETGGQLQPLMAGRTISMRTSA